jgi:hypothetical protein
MPVRARLSPGAAPIRPAPRGAYAALIRAVRRIRARMPDRGTGRGPVSASTELITAVGPLLGAQIGESLRLRGRWTSHMKYGRQFDVHSYTTVLPATEQGIRRYLGSGLIKGIGPVMAERMVNHFGVDIMHIIDDEPDRLIEVPGLGPKRSTRIKDAWAEQKAIKQVMIFLQGVGVSTSLPEPRLVTDAGKILEVPADLIAPRVADLAAEEGAVIETLPVPGAAAAEPLRAVYLPPFFHAERSLATVFRNLLATGKDRLPAFQSVEWDKLAAAAQRGCHGGGFAWFTRSVRERHRC